MKDALKDTLKGSAVAIEGNPQDRTASQLRIKDGEIEKIIPFLIDSDREAYPKGYRHLQKVVVHCSSGVGRTGIVLASWLVAQRGFSNPEALSATLQNRRNPYEAIIAATLRFQNPCQVRLQLNRLLNDCRAAFL